MDTAIATTSDAFLYSINKLCHALGVSRDLVSHRISRIEPAKQINGHDVYHLRDVVTLIKDKTSEDPEDLSPRERRDWYEGELRRVDIEKKKGLLLIAEDVRETWAETLKAIMLMLDTLVDVVERDVGLNTEQIGLIQSIIDRQRDQLYNVLCTQAQAQS